MVYLTIGGLIISNFFTWFFTMHYYSKGKQEMLKKDEYNLKSNQLLMKELNILTGKNVEIIHDEEGMPKGVEHVNIEVPSATATSECGTPKIVTENKNEEKQ